MPTANQMATASWNESTVPNTLLWESGGDEEARVLDVIDVEDLCQQSCVPGTSTRAPPLTSALG